MRVFGVFEDTRLLFRVGEDKRGDAYELDHVRQGLRAEGCVSLLKQAQKLNSIACQAALFLDDQTRSICQKSSSSRALIPLKVGYFRHYVGFSFADHLTPLREVP